MGDLDSQLERLKAYGSELSIKALNKRIYNLDLDDIFLASLSQNHLIYVHVKLHAAISYKKPFAKIEDIKKSHSLVVKFLSSHFVLDELDI